jgi:hypothetical protein
MMPSNRAIPTGATSGVKARGKGGTSSVLPKIRFLKIDNNYYVK